MKHFRRTFHHNIIKGLAVGLMLLTLGAQMERTLAQERSRTATTTATRTRERDPFEKYRPPVKRVKPIATQIPAPSIKDRIERYKAQKLAAMNAQLPAPKPTTALLLGEVQITGIFRTPRGYAAMVEATPIKLSYVIYPGETFFDGQLVAIEEDRLVFRREARWSDGRREMLVEIKPLRQANAVTDSMTSVRGATTTNAPGTEPSANQGARAASSNNQ
ncbi:MAG TPA: hypothetical protein VE842_19380 [Pyrinomonadaceae bacterium]|jgi:hypothetical protein|nr:hypothetical protein [Pyrinomonadaceae bacterium]